jgi:hypothetical protein
MPTVLFRFAIAAHPRQGWPQTGAGRRRGLTLRHTQKVQLPIRHTYISMWICGKFRPRICGLQQKGGRTYLSFRKGKGTRIRLPDDPSSLEFAQAYAAAMAGETIDNRVTPKTDGPGTLGALIADYKKNGSFQTLRATSKKGYTSRLETMRVAHGHRSVTGLTRDRTSSNIAAAIRASRSAWSICTRVIVIPSCSA